MERIVSEAAGRGFSAVEIRGIGGCMELGRIPAFLPENRAATRKLFDAVGISICSLDTSCRFHTAGECANAMVEGREAVTIASDMGIPYVRVFGDFIPPEVPEKETLSCIAAGIRELCVFAENTGVQVLLETHGDLITPERLLDVAEKVARPEFGLIWDIDHIFGCTHTEMYRAIKPYVRHVHLKDSYHAADNSTVLCLPGEGERPLADIVRMLLADGYDGYLSLEWEKHWHDYLPDLEIALSAYVDLLSKIN